MKIQFVLIILHLTQILTIHFSINKTTNENSDLLSKYYISIPFGSSNGVNPISQVELLLDLSFEPSWIITNKCKNHCHSNDTYNTQLSQYYNVISNATYFIDYVGGYVEGVKSSDCFFINNDTMSLSIIKGFSFVSSFFDENFEGIELQGTLSIYNFTNLLYTNIKFKFNNSSSKYVVIDLKEDNNSRAYFFESPLDEKYNLKKVRNISYDLNLVLNLSQIKIYSNYLNPCSKNIKLDFSTQFIHIPLCDFENIQQIIGDFVKTNCELKNKFFYCIINSKLGIQAIKDNFPDFLFLINDEWFRLSYMENLFISQMSKDSLIIQFPFIISPNINEWILGTNFVKNYYVILDFDKNIIGLQQKIDFGGKYFSIIPLIVGLGAIFLTYIFVYIYFKYCFSPKNIS